MKKEKKILVLGSSWANAIASNLGASYSNWLDVEAHGWPGATIDKILYEVPKYLTKDHYMLLLFVLLPESWVKVSLDKRGKYTIYDLNKNISLWEFSEKVERLEQYLQNKYGEKKPRLILAIPPLLNIYKFNKKRVDDFPEDIRLLFYSNPEYSKAEFANKTHWFFDTMSDLSLDLYNWPDKTVMPLNFIYNSLPTMRRKLTLFQDREAEDWEDEKYLVDGIHPSKIFLRCMWGKYYKLLRETVPSNRIITDRHCRTNEVIPPSWEHDRHRHTNDVMPPSQGQMNYLPDHWEYPYAQLPLPTPPMEERIVESSIPVISEYSHPPPFYGRNDSDLPHYSNYPMSYEAKNGACSSSNPYAQFPTTMPAMEERIVEPFVPVPNEYSHPQPFYETNNANSQEYSNYKMPYETRNDACASFNNTSQPSIPPFFVNTMQLMITKMEGWEMVNNPNISSTLIMQECKAHLERLLNPGLYEFRQFSQPFRDCHFKARVAFYREQISMAISKLEGWEMAQSTGPSIKQLKSTVIHKCIDAIDQLK